MKKLPLIPFFLLAIVLVSGSYLLLNQDILQGRFTATIEGPLTIALASSPTSATYSAGSTDVEFLGISFKCKTGKEGCKVTDLEVQGYLDDAGSTSFATTSSATTHGTELGDYVGELSLVDSSGVVISTESVNYSNFKATFDRLDIELNPGDTAIYTLVGDISSSAFANEDAESIAFGISGSAVTVENIPDGESISVSGQVNSIIKKVVITTSR
jgi:hypothetical protein